MQIRQGVVNQDNDLKGKAVSLINSKGGNVSTDMSLSEVINNISNIGKKWASGLVVHSSGISTISGLDFKPSYIIVNRGLSTNSGNSRVYFVYNGTEYYQSDGGTSIHRIQNVMNNSFEVFLGTSATFYWFAFE